MSAQSYIKFWTAEPSEHDEVQAYDLLSYEKYIKSVILHRKSSL